MSLNLKSCTESVVYSLKNHVLHVTLNRANKRNALDNAMYSALAEAIEYADTDAQVRAVLIYGSEDCFTAGNDLSSFANPDQEGYAEIPALRMIRALIESQTPLIAAVAGPAVGVGTTLLLHCDLIYAANNSKFRLPFSQLGLVPEAASSLLLPRLVGHQKAMELLVLGDVFGAATAREIGMVNAVVDTGVISLATDEAERLAQLAPASVQATKNLLREPLRQSLRDANDAEQKYFQESLSSAEAREAMQAFLEKRPARF